MKQKLETALVLVMGLSAGAANAQVCATQPTCESLGFMQKAADCSGKLLLKCPFDTTKVFCGGDCSSFTLTFCDASKGDCISCGGKYKYTSCNDGWTLSNGNCNPSSCSGYSYTSCPSSASSCSTCKSGTMTKYKIAKCAGDKVLSSGSCVSPDRNCGGGFFSRKSSYATSFDTCTGEDTGRTYYKSTACTTNKVCECNGRSYAPRYSPNTIGDACSCGSCAGEIEEE